MGKPTRVIAQSTEEYALDPVYISPTDLLTIKILRELIIIYMPLFPILMILFYLIEESRISFS